MTMDTRDLAIRRWAMKSGKDLSERAVLYALAQVNGRGTLAEIRAAARTYAGPGLSDRIACRPALRRLAQRKQVNQLASGRWEAK
jgi:hypothetical protein